MDTLVSISELNTNLDNPGWIVIDCRFSLADPNAGENAYKEAHIPGAFYLSLEKHLSSPHIPGKTGRHPLPDKQAWIKTLQSLGIDPDKQVVTYDDAGGAMAARLWWMLRWTGHAKVAVLDGSWQAWNKAGLEVSATCPALPDSSNHDYGALPALVKSIAADAINAEAQVLLDARELPRFRGDTEPLDSVAGHIPGAVCSPFSANLDAQGNFLPPDALKQKFQADLASSKPVVCYCGSGVTAAHNILAMKIAGFDEAVLYPGSWSEWITDPARPVATGD